MSENARTGSGRLAKWLAVCGASALVAFGTGFAIYNAQDAPQLENFSVETTNSPANIQLTNPQGVLTAEDIARLERDIPRLPQLASVRTIHFMAFGERENVLENVNDTVENYFRDNFPDQINDNRGFADGTLIIVADMAARQHGIYAADDVDAAIDLQPRTDRLLDTMKPGLQNGNLPGAFFAAASQAMDPEAIATERFTDAQDGRTLDSIFGGFGTGALTLGIGSGAVLWSNSRRKRIDQARTDYELISTEYAGLAQRLPELDIRANSLSSGFADLELRKQWQQVRDRFLALHGAISKVGTPADDAAFLGAHKELARTAKAVRHTSNAEDNINRIFRMEQGDSATRRAELTRLREDVLAARAKISTPSLRTELSGLLERVDALDQHPASSTFVDDYLRLLGDYRVVLDAVRTKEFSDVKERNKLEAPTLADRDFWYSNYVPFVVLNSWHTSNVEAANAAASSSSSGVNTTFSSGFSAAGGSSSF